MGKYLIKVKMPFPLTKRGNKNPEEGKQCETSVSEPSKCSCNMHPVQ